MDLAKAPVEAVAITGTQKGRRYALHWTRISLRAIAAFYEFLAFCLTLAIATAAHFFRIGYFEPPVVRISHLFRPGSQKQQN